MSRREHRHQRTAFTTGAALLCVFLPGFLPAGLTLDKTTGSTIRLIHNGKRLSEQPARFVIQEWQVREESSPAANRTPERNTVGSIVESEDTGGGMLAPRGDAWNEIPRQALVRSGTAVEQTVTFSSGLELEAAWESAGGYVYVSGNVWNASTEPGRTERPITLSLVLPLDGPNREWLSSNHITFSAESPQERIESVATTAGARGAMSRYPFGAMKAADSGIAAGFPLDRPVIHRIRWDGEREALIAEIDVTISSETKHFPDRVPFEFLLFEFDAEFGFRGALQSYYDLNPDSYALRLERQGQWMPFTQIDTVERPEDFCFQFHEYHPNVSVAWNRANGVESLVYCEPPVQYVNLAAGTPRTLEALQKIVQNLDNRQGSQIRISHGEERDGSMQAAWVETPWAVGARIPTNGDPELLRSERNPYNSFDANWLAYQDLYRRHAEDRPDAWQGSGTIQEGVLGAQGRALCLRPGGSATQTILESRPGNFRITFRAMAREDSALILAVQSSSGQKTETSVPISESSFLQPVQGVLSVPRDTHPQLTLSATNAELWLDDLQIEGIGVRNAGFEKGQLDNEAVTGLYLDSFEGWDSKDLNFRREHFATTDYPLTFDARTGQTAQVIMMHNFELAEEARRRLHDRGHLLMANTALYQWAWSAHFLDILGIETSWGEGPTISPPRIDEMDYLRSMLYHKPYCYLQNLRYENFRGKKVEDYFARCFHYGFWPGFFSHNAAEAPYWHDPSLYNADRPHFLRFMRPQVEITASGWEPVTLAASDDPEILIERWGGGPLLDSGLGADRIYYTLYNPTSTLRAGKLILDSRVFDGQSFVAIDILNGNRIPVGGDQSVGFELDPLGVTGFMLAIRDEGALADAIGSQAAIVAELDMKYRRFGFLESGPASDSLSFTQPGMVREWANAVRPRLDPLYEPEFERAVAIMRILHAVHAETQVGVAFEPALPVSVSPGEETIVTVPLLKDVPELVLETNLGGKTETVSFADGEARFPVPAGIPIGEKIGLTIRPRESSQFWPWYEASVEVRPAATFLRLPDTISVAGTKDLRFALRSNLQKRVAGKLEVSGPAPLDSIPRRDLRIAPGREVQIQYELRVEDRPETEDVRGNLAFSWTVDGRTPVSQTVPIVILPKNASIVRDPSVTVRVDSFYYGYDAKPLTDGITDTSDLDWKDAAWASDEGMVPHWVEFEFDEPVRTGEVIIHWALDGGEFWTSQQVHVQTAEDSQSPWETVATHEASVPESLSKLEFAEREVRRLRLFQPTGMGPAGRPGIMWLREVEVR